MPEFEDRMAIQVSFLGVTTLLISDGKTNLLTDGFFSRPGRVHSLLGRIDADPAAIRVGLAKAGITRLDAVLVGHSHYDHALDAPETARQTGAVLAGSGSTLNIGRGNGFPEEKMLLAHEKVQMCFGDFRVRWIPSRHNRTYLARGIIRQPLIPPTSAFSYRDGGCFSILVDHPDGNLLIQESAGYLPGALQGLHAETVFLAVSGIGRAPAVYRETLFRETVLAVGASRLVPIHYDDFSRPFTNPPTLMPWWVDDIPSGLTYLEQSAQAAGIRFELWEPYQVVVL